MCSPIQTLSTTKIYSFHHQLGNVCMCQCNEKTIVYALFNHVVVDRSKSCSRKQPFGHYSPRCTNCVNRNTALNFVVYYFAMPNCTCEAKYTCTLYCRGLFMSGSLVMIPLSLNPGLLSRTTPRSVYGAKPPGIVGKGGFVRLTHNPMGCWVSKPPRDIFMAALLVYNAMTNTTRCRIEGTN